MIQYAETAALDIADVEKIYKKGRVRALSDAPLTVMRGEVFGLLGPNGAGKSTLVKILMTVVKPTRCQGHLLGRPIGDKNVLSRVGYLPEHHKFPDYLTGRQICEYIAAMAGVPRERRRNKAMEMLELVGMKEWSEAKIGGYSKGMRQRVGIAQALVNDPEIILLDEPTDGVDPVGRRDIRDLIKHLKSSGVTVFLNSHLLSELELVCDRVAIMVKGRVVQQGTIDSLTLDQQRVEIELTDEANAAAVAGALPAIDGVRVESSGRMLNLYGATPELAQGALDACRQKGAVVRRFHETRPSLEDLFMSAVANDSSVGAAGGHKKQRQGGER